MRTEPRTGPPPPSRSPRTRNGRKGPEHAMLRIDHLVKSFAGEKARGKKAKAQEGHATVFAVNDVSFEVKEGELFTLLGPSGCGKTTTLRSIAGLEKPDSGQDHRRRPGAVLRRRQGRRPRGQHARQPARSGHGLPVLRDLAAHDRLRQRRLPAAGAQARRPALQGGDRRARRAGARHDGALPAGRPPGHQALRRPAAAPRAGPRAGHPAAAAAARRAAVQPRRQAARVAALRAQAAAARAGHHLGLRHPRPGRGAGAVHAHRRHAGRQRGAAGQAARGLREPGQQVRRRVHRHVELHPRHGRVRARRPALRRDDQRPAAPRVAAPTCPTGSDVVVSIRPEAVELSTDEPRGRRCPTSGTARSWRAPSSATPSTTSSPSASTRSAPGRTRRCRSSRAPQVYLQLDPTKISLVPVG